MYLVNMEICCILRHAAFTLLFSMKCHIFHQFVFLCSSNTFFIINSVLKFEYQHSHLKVQGLFACSVFLCLQYVSIYAAYLYDAVMLYARALDTLLQKYEVVTEEDLYKVASNGTLIIEMLKNRTYDSKCLDLCAKTHSGSVMPVKEEEEFRSDIMFVIRRKQYLSTLKTLWH